MAEEIDFENRHFWNFKSHVTLTLTSDDLESRMVVNVSSTPTNNSIWFVAVLSLIVDVPKTRFSVVWQNAWGDFHKFLCDIPSLTYILCRPNRFGFGRIKFLTPYLLCCFYHQRTKRKQSFSIPVQTDFANHDCDWSRIEKHFNCTIIEISTRVMLALRRPTQTFHSQCWSLELQTSIATFLSK